MSHTTHQPPAASSASAHLPDPRSSESFLAPGVVRPAGWEAFPWLRAGFSTREGGATTVYGLPNDLNLGWTDTDTPATIALNRRRFAQAVTGPGSAVTPAELVAVRQIHSAVIHVVEDQASAPLATPDGKPTLQGDGLLTARPNCLLAILTADCVPVLIADTRLRVVAGFHAGWRGTLGRIVERGVDTLRRRFGSDPADLIAAVGPAIGACCYAVGEEVRNAFTEEFAYAASLFAEVHPSGSAAAPGPQIHLDLAAANRRQLLSAGVPTQAITVVGECTACTRLPSGQRRYFSHRDEHGFTGRMLSVIGIGS